MRLYACAYHELRALQEPPDARRDVGDFLCLLYADVGVVINSSARMRKLAILFGVKHVPPFPTLVKKQKELVTNGSGLWHSVYGLLLG